MPGAASGRDLARAHHWKRMLEEGRYASIGEMAAAERIDRGYLGRILQLTLLAPDIVEAILDGRQPDGVGLPTLMEPMLSSWDEQRAALNGCDSSGIDVRGAAPKARRTGAIRTSAPRTSPGEIMGRGGSGK